MGVYRFNVDLTFPVGQGRGTNSWTCRTAEPFAFENVNEWATTVQEFYAALAIIFPTSYSATWDGTFRELGTQSPEFREPQTGWTVTGDDSGTAYAGAPVMACVTWRTSLASRSGRGRTFLGPLSRNAIEANGTISPSQLSVIRSAAATLVSESTFDLQAGSMSVWSETDQVARDIIGATVTDQCAVLRSRR